MADVRCRRVYLRSSAVSFPFSIPAITRDVAITIGRAPQIRRASNCHRERAETAGSRTIQIGGAHFAALCRCTLSQIPHPHSTFVESKS